MITDITFVTIGQTPRDDLVPELSASFSRAVTVREAGALDGLSPEEIAALAPAPGDSVLVTRLRDGSQVVVGKPAIHQRLEALLAGSPTSPGSATVLLCTGTFEDIRSPGLFLHAQSLVDHGVEAICSHLGTVGTVVPLAEQEDDIRLQATHGAEVRCAHASPYDDADFEAVGRALSTCDVIVMHCMGYTQGQRTAVAEGSGRPVLLARGLVASALVQLL